jgi:uncharacterized protein YcfJ
MASIVGRAVTGIAGIVVGGNVATSVASDLAGAAIGAAGSINTTYVERDSSSTIERDSSTVDVRSTEMRDTLRDTSTQETTNR